MNSCIAAASAVTAVYILIVAIWFRKRMPKSKPRRRNLMEEESCSDRPEWAEPGKWRESL